MKKISFILLFFFVFSSASYAFFWDNYLVKINGKVYTKEDYLKWWNYWKEPGMKIPETPDSFIDWILLSDEAKRLALDEDPSYKHRLKVFLEVRSLLLLKNEEVDSKIDLSRSRLWQEYTTNYVPRLRIKALLTKDEKEAQRWKREIKNVKDFEKIFKKLQKVGKARDFGWERPITIPKDLRKQVLSASQGAILGPLFHKGTYFVLYVKEKFGPDEEDFKGLEREIAYKIHKREETLYTEQLIKKLKNKYKVVVNWKIIDQINLDVLPKEIADKEVLNIDGRSLKAKDFFDKLKKEVDLRFHNKKISSEQLNKLKHFIINTYIAQTLTSLEAIDRHYENTPLLRDLYLFYKRQLLVNELERKIIWPQIKVTEQEALKFYEEHKKDFTKPEMVEIAVIKTQDPKLIREVYKRIKGGEDFFDVGKEVQFHGTHPERYALKQLVPEMRKVIKKLKPGQISPIIKFKKGNDVWYCIVYLIKYYPEEAHPFKMVKNNIIKMLKQQKFQTLKEKYIKQLRAHSKIEVNGRVWRELRKQLEEANVHKR